MAKTRVDVCHTDEAPFMTGVFINPKYINEQQQFCCHGQERRNLVSQAAGSAKLLQKVSQCYSQCTVINILNVQNPGPYCVEWSLHVLTVSI